MTWKVRHAGSPRAVEGLTLAQVAEGLEEGRWDPTDEVRGPDDADWVAIEQHPQLEETAAALEPPSKHDEDEARLDFNPLIDVALVLLIFFILTTSYAALQKVLDMPTTTSKNVEGPIRVTRDKVEQTTIKVEARSENGKPVVRVEDQIVEMSALTEVLRGFAERTNKAEVLLDARGVDWGTFIAIQDATAGVKRITKVHLLVPPKPK